MGYVHCMPATVREMRHGLDNVVAGQLDTPIGLMEFRTRGHIVKATNRIYRGVEWKPSRNARVLVDGEITKGFISIGAEAEGFITIDHIEADLLTDEPSNDPLVAEIGAMLPNHPPASRMLRVWRQTSPWRVRLVPTFPHAGDYGARTEGIVHLMCDPQSGTISAWSVCRATGKLLHDADPAPALLAALGRPLPDPPPEPEEEIEPISDLDDCPF